MDKKELTLEVISRLAKEYPDADCTLEYENGWQLLISVRLAAQCTDKRVDEITPKLYAKFPTVADLARADVSEIEAIVRPCGLGNVKARDISKCMKVLHEKYNDEIPRTFKELLALPGVGRKSANLVMGDVFGEPAIVTVAFGHVDLDTRVVELHGLVRKEGGIAGFADVEGNFVDGHEVEVLRRPTFGHVHPAAGHFFVAAEEEGAVAGGD